MPKLVALIADDERTYRKHIIKWFTEQQLYPFFDSFIECKYIKENVNGDKNFDTIIKDTQQLDLALVDMQWLETGFNGWEGGYYLINEIESKFPHCLILPITQFRFSEEILPRVDTPSGKRYDAIPKDGDDIDKSTRFYSYLEPWLLYRIKHINNTPQWHKILSALQNNNYSDSIIINECNWILSDFLFPETILNGSKFFSRENLIPEIKKLISYPKNNKLWGSHDSWNKLSETYFKFIEIDEMRGYKKLIDIESKANVFINNFVELLIEQDNKSGTNSIPNLAKIQQLRCHQCKENDIPDISNITKISDIPEDYFDNLLIRYLVLMLCRIASKANKPNWNNTYIIYRLFDHGLDSYASIKSFYYHLGFNVENNSIKYSSYMSDIFFKESDFIENFNYSPILNKITTNNQDNYK